MPAKKKTKKKVGRPRAKIDWDKVKKLCYIHCTKEEIAHILEISEDTIDRACKREYKDNFAVLYKRWSAGGKMSLRRKQVEVAMKGNVSMLIWLGKQQLNQKDKHEENLGETEFEFEPDKDFD